MNKRKYIFIGSVLIIFLVLSSVLLISKKVKEVSKNNNDPVIKIEHLSIDNSAKSIYYINEEYEKPKIIAIFNNGLNIDITESHNLEIVGYNMQQPGTYDVLIRYSYEKQNLYTTYRIVVLSNDVVNISVTCKKSELIWGKSLSNKDLIVTAEFSDGRVEEIENYKIRYNSKPQECGPITVTIIYENLTTNFNINIVETTIEEKYVDFSNEAIKLLSRFGIDNPKTPIDYSLDIDAYGTPSIRFSGEFENQSVIDENEISYYLSSYFYDYEYIDGPIDSFDFILPCKMIVLKNSNNGFEVSFYLSRMFGNIKYIVVIKKGPIK